MRRRRSRRGGRNGTFLGGNSSAGRAPVRGGRKKKAPGKAMSQGGKGQDPVPGAIGRWRLANPVLRSLGAKRRSASMPTAIAPWSAENVPERNTSRCGPVHVDRSIRRAGRERERPPSGARMPHPSDVTFRTRGGENTPIVRHGQARFFAGMSAVLPESKSTLEATCA